MHSLQYHIAMLVMRYKKWTAPPPGVNVARSRQDMLANAQMFNRQGNWQVTPVKVGELEAEWVTAPGGEAGKVVLYLHGGSFICGSPETHRSMVGILAESFHGRCLSLDYRLAPEYIFPAQVEDARQAYAWLLAQGIPASNLVVAGDSAGGTLTMMLLLALRDAHQPLPAGAVLICPATDLTFSGETITTNAKHDLILDPITLRQEVQLFMGESDPHSPHVSPLFADQHGLPPVYIQAGGHDILLSDSTRLADKLKQAGVQVVLDVEPNGQHDYQFAASVVPEARQALERLGKFIQSL